MTSHEMAFPTISMKLLHSMFLTSPPLRMLMTLLTAYSHPRRMVRLDSLCPIVVGRLVFSPRDSLTFCFAVYFPYSNVFSLPFIISLWSMRMDPDTPNDGLHHSGKARQFNAANFFAIIAMGVGSIGYGYSANVIAPILGTHQAL